jgi:UPF0271 protein
MPDASMERAVDLNADVGEGYGRWTLGDDDALMRVITSANIACGFHAGDPSIIRATCRSAVAHGVTIGAQVGYPDLVGFGRRFIDMEFGALVDALLYQISALEGLARVEGSNVRFVKPHGALYNAIVHHESQANAVVEAMIQHGGALALVGLPGSTVETVARRRGIRFIGEGFADRRYTPDGRLVPRSEADALITDDEAAIEQAVRLAGRGVATVCVHSDTPGASRMARSIRDALVAAGFTLAPVGS